MPKVATEEATNKVVMFVNNIYYPYTGIAKFFTMTCSIHISSVNDKYLSTAWNHPYVLNEYCSSLLRP